MDYTIPNRCPECHKKILKLEQISYDMTRVVKEVIAWYCRNCKIITLNPKFNFNQVRYGGLHQNSLSVPVATKESLDLLLGIK